MLQRIFVIVAILAGIGVIAVSQFKVKPHIEGIIGERNDWHSKKDNEEKLKKKALADLKSTQNTLADTERKLGQTEKDLAATRTQVANEQKRAINLKAELDSTAKDLKSAQQELAAWKLLGIPVEQVKKMIDDLKKALADIEALNIEKKVIAKERDRLQGIVDMVFKGNQDFDLPMPAGLVGKVLVVDPKWNFVVLDIGANQQVQEKCIGLICRDGKLVAQVKIKSVQSDRSIANVRPGWSLGEIMEGDLVVPASPSLVVPAHHPSLQNLINVQNPTAAK